MSGFETRLVTEAEEIIEQGDLFVSRRTKLVFLAGFFLLLPLGFIAIFWAMFYLQHANACESRRKKYEAAVLRQKRAEEKERKASARRQDSSAKRAPGKRSPGKKRRAP